jgi:hypothetical protein
VHPTKLFKKYEKIISQNFSLLSPVSLTPLINIHSQISPRIFEKFEMVLMGYSGVRGKLIYEKTLKLKISCQAPFNMTRNLYGFSQGGRRLEGWQAGRTACLSVPYRLP